MESARVAKLEALLVRVQKNAAAPRAAGAHMPQIAAAPIAAEPQRAAPVAAAPVAAFVPQSPPTPIAAPTPAPAPILGAPTAPVARPVARPAAPPLSASRQPVTTALPSMPTPLPPPIEPAPIMAAFTQPEPAPEIEAREIDLQPSDRDDLDLDGDRDGGAPREVEASHVEVPREVEAAHGFEAPYAPPADATPLAAAMASFKPHAPSPEAAARVAASRPPEPAPVAVAPRDAGGIAPAVRPVALANAAALAPAKAERSWGRILLLVALWTIAGVGVAMAYLSTR